MPECLIILTEVEVPPTTGSQFREAVLVLLRREGVGIPQVEVGVGLDLDRLQAEEDPLQDDDGEDHVAEVGVDREVGLLLVV